MKLLSYIPEETLDSVREHGLLSGDVLARPENRHLLELARPGKAADEWLAFREQKLKEEPWKASFAGPSAFFGQPDTDRIKGDATHPMNQRKSVPLQIDLEALLRDAPDTRLHGVELAPGKSLWAHLSDEQWDAMSDEEKEPILAQRHHDLKIDEIKQLIERAKNPKELWKHFEPGHGRYAGDVPHVQIIHPTGKIDPKYLEFPEAEKSAMTVAKSLLPEVSHWVSRARNAGALFPWSDEFIKLQHAFHKPEMRTHLPRFFAEAKKELPESKWASNAVDDIIGTTKSTTPWMQHEKWVSAIKPDDMVEITHGGTRDFLNRFLGGQNSGYQLERGGAGLQVSPVVGGSANRAGHYAARAAANWLDQPVVMRAKIPAKHLLSANNAYEAAITKEHIPFLKDMHIEDAPLDDGQLLSAGPKFWEQHGIFTKKASTYVPIGVPKPMPKAPMKSPMAHHRYLADDDEHEKYAPVGIDGLLAATEKLLAVNRGLAETDDRDSLPNDRVHTVDRLMAERVKLDHGHALRAMMGRLSRMRTLDPVGPDAFGGYTMGYLKSNPLVTALEEINPMHILEQKRRITKMGPGGIGDPNAITDDMTAVSATQFGFVDPLAGPESEKAGIDVRLAHGARVGSDGRIYQLLINRRTGKKEWVSPSNLRGKTLKLPD